jgi:hypothetical protein
MIKTKFFMHVISPTEGIPVKIDEQINEWVEETGHEILEISLSGNIVGEEGREIVRALVRYKENEELTEENSDIEKADTEDDIGYVDEG